MKTFLNLLGKFILTLFFVLTLYLTYLAFFDKQVLLNIIEWLKEVVETLGPWNYVVVFVSSLIESFPVLGILIPGQNTLLISGGFYAKVDYMGIIFVASFGAVLGNYIGYLLGKYWGMEFLEKHGDWFGVGKTEGIYLKKGVEKYGAVGITFSKFHQVARAFIPFVAGAYEMKPKSFIIYNIIGSIIWSVTFVSIGLFFADNYEIIVKYIGYIMLGLIVLFGLYIYKFKRQEFKKYLELKNNEIDEKISKKFAKQLDK
ncbi:MAG: DedA family protein [Candidatus Gracilibacteria bacterium]|nr:DedA family protein [Candidatus Gracilibacteria bacterium]